MSAPPFEVDHARLRRLLDASARIGASQDPARPGLDRRALAPNDLAGRAWLKKIAVDLGLSVHEDAAMNVHFRLGWPEDEDDGANPTPARPAVVTGSHHDAVGGGGALDGALGVVAGIEALARVRELQRSGALPARLTYPLEVVDFTDEEGRFGGMFGSMCTAGTIDADALLKLKDVAGAGAAQTLADARGRGETAAQAARNAVAQARYARGSVRAYVELHIEQGPVLDTAGETLGVVSGICGLWKARWTLTGQANHAGTTPMRLRRNAFEGCAAVQGAIPALLERHGNANGATVCTIGAVNVVPNVPNVVPGVCVFTTEVRDEDPAVLAAMQAALRAQLRDVAERFGLGCEVHVMSDMAPVAADRAVMGVLRRECARAGVAKARVMPSGAAHDAQQMANVGPMGMLFVPSIDGVSHHHSERTHFADVARGASVLLNALVALATGAADGAAAARALEAELDDGGDDNNDGAAAAAGGASGEAAAAAARSTAASHTALLCIDLQDMSPTSAREGTDFDDASVAAFRAGLPPVLARVRAAQEAARALRGCEVVHCRIMSKTRDGRDRSALHKRMQIHVPPSAVPGGASSSSSSQQGRWLDGVAPAGDELVFNKTGSNAFCTTNIHYVLGNVGVRSLVCCGVLTDECVAGTVKAACDLGYACTVLEDACLAGAPERHAGAIATLRRFARVTSTAAWLAEVGHGRKAAL